jgi:tetratricopeptide (TPR) repeat protein
MVLVQYRLGHLDEALRTAESVRQTYPDQIPVLLWLAAQYEAVGRHEEARAVVAEMLAVNPDLRIDELGECLRGGSAAELPVFQENLRRAGLP